MGKEQASLTTLWAGPDGSSNFGQHMKLSIVIVSYSTADLTKAALESIFQTLKGTALAKSTEVIVIDNNSKDDSVKMLRQIALQHPQQLRIITNPKNTGFARANNQGIKAAKGDYILLLNSDTIVQPGALEALVAQFESHPIQDSTSVLARTNGELDRLGLVSAQLLNRDMSIQPHGGSFPTLFSLANHWLMLDDIPIIGAWLPSTQHTGKRQIVSEPSVSQELEIKDWVGATALLIRREVFDEIGVLDEAIFMYGEDVEFCLRAASHHWDCVIAPDAKVVHLGSASSTPINALKGEFLSYIYIWSKHKPLWQIPLVHVILRLGACLRWFLFGTMVKDPVKRDLYRSLFWSGENSKL